MYGTYLSMVLEILQGFNKWQVQNPVFNIFVARCVQEFRNFQILGSCSGT